MSEGMNTNISREDYIKIAQCEMSAWPLERLLREIVGGHTVQVG